MAQVAKKQQFNFWHSRRTSLAMGVLSLLAMYLVASRAIDTGSLQQYALTIILLGFAINRFINAIRSKSI